MQGLTLLNTASSDISLNGKKYKSLVGKATFTGNILFKNNDNTPHNVSTLFESNNATGNGGVIANILNGTNYIPVVIEDNHGNKTEFELNERASFTRSNAPSINIDNNVNIYD